MDYFGEYLVEKKIVSADKLVLAMIQQMQDQPSPAKIALDENLISATNLLHLFKVQYEKQIDFFTAANIEKLLTSDQIQIIKEKMQRLQLSLPSILLKNGDVEVKNLVNALDEFLTLAKITKNTN